MEVTHKNHSSHHALTSSRRSSSLHIFVVCHKCVCGFEMNCVSPGCTATKRNDKYNIQDDGPLTLKGVSKGVFVSK